MDTRIRDLSRTLKKARAKSGLTYEQIARRVATIVGEEANSRTAQTIANYHNGDITWKRIDVVLLAAVLEIYGLRALDLGIELQERCKSVCDLLDRVAGCLDRSAGQTASAAA